MIPAIMGSAVTVERECIDPAAICAHPFQGKCIAKKHKHLCDQMKKRVADKGISTTLGN